MVLQCDLIVLNDTFLCPPNIWQRFAAFVIVIPSVQNVFCIHFFVVAGFLQHYMCFFIHALPHGWLMSGSMGRILFKKWRSRRLTGRRIWPCSTVDSFPTAAKISHRCSYTMPTSQFWEQSGHCILEEISHSSKYSVLHNSSVLFKSSINESQFGWFSNCWISFLRFPCDKSLLSELLSEVYLEFCNQRYRDKFPCTEFPRTSRFVRFDWSEDVLASGLERSWRPWCKFGVSTTRGNLGDWYTLKYKSSPVFMYTTFSIHIAGKVLNRAIAWDRVW